MNLTIDPWIPVIGADGRRRLLSLLDLFAYAHELRDLSAQPHEKIALLRLLICITQAALDGPENPEDWETCRSTIQPSTKTYLEKWATSFNLFGNGARFLQVPGLRASKEDADSNPATKLDLSLSSGNNSTLFDNSAGVIRTVPPGKLALTLLAFQCFAPGGRIGVAKWNNVDTPGKGSSNHAPCTPSGMLHTFLKGVSILETLHLNLLTKETIGDLGPKYWGKPIWEFPVNTERDLDAISNATASYLGRLTPLSRSIRLNEDGQRMILANGLDYPTFPVFRDTAVTLVQRDQGLAVLSVSLGRSIWRQLPAITVKGRAKSDSISGPLALGNIDGNQNCTLWIGALATDKAKIEDVVEASYDVPAGMFQDAGRKLYEEGVELAVLWQRALSESVKAYAVKMFMEAAPSERARHYFWTRIEQDVSILLMLTKTPEEVGDLKTSEWGKRAKQAAQASFALTCPCQTPRQIQAYSVGLQYLFLKKPKTLAETSNKKTSFLTES